MLVLSRQRDETIVIGDNIEVTVVDIRGDKVRLGITAPKTITVHRKEVYDAIQKEHLASAPTGAAASAVVAPPSPPVAAAPVATPNGLAADPANKPAAP